MDKRQKTAYAAYLRHLKIYLDLMQESIDKGDNDALSFHYYAATNYLHGLSIGMIYADNYYGWFFSRAQKMVNKYYHF